MNLETKEAIGGMDSDNAIEYIQPQDYITAHNYRPTGTDSQDKGYGNNMESTVEIASVLPLGITKTVGSAAFETIRRVIEVKYNSNGNHQLLEIDGDNKIETVLFENKLNSAGIDIFKLNPQSYMTDIRLVQDRWVIMTDGVGEVYNFDLKMLRNRTDRPLISSDITLSKKMPLTVPQVNYGDDSNYSVNNLRGKLFQFRSQFKYGGNMFSAHSPISKRPTPSNEGSSELGQSVTRDNYILVKVQLGDDATERLLISMRYNESNIWYIVKDLDMSYIYSLPNSEIDLSLNIKEAYSPVTQTYTFVFYNDGAYSPIDFNETDLPYDAIPKTARTVEVINGNVVALGGITEGYDRPQDVDVSVTTSNYKINIGTNIVGGGNFDVIGSYERFYISSNLSYYSSRLKFSGTPSVGDVIKVVLVESSNPALTSQVLNHVVTAAEALDLNLLYTHLSAEIVGGQVNGASKNATGLTFTTIAGRAPYKIKSATVDLANIGTIDTKSYNVLKSGSMYQTALAYYDEYGRYFPIVSNDSFKVQTTPIAESEGLTPQINWVLNSKPPAGAVAYEWLITENLKMLNYVTLTGKFDAARSTTGEYMVFEIPSLQRFIDANKGVVSYQFTDGDKVTFIKTTNGTSPTAVKWFKFSAVESDVISFDVEVADGEEPKYYLKVRKSSNLEEEDLDGKEVEFEIYSPRPIGDEKSSLFYGSGDVYPIIGGEHSVTSGTIREGDTYLKGRIYESTITPSTAIPYIVEDPNFSDSFASKYYSYGRARSYYDELGEVNKRGSIRYSDVSVLGGQYNGLNRFYLGRIYGEGAGETTSKYGTINKLQMRDNYLVVIHELKVGHIPVYLSIVEDNEGNLQVADSSKLFGSVRYLSGNYGTGSAKDSVCVSKSGNIYFVDDNNSVVVRDGLDGIRVINGNQSKWFNERIKKAKAAGDRIISYYNDFYNELNITFLTTEGEVYQFDFNNSNWNMKDSYSVLADEITITNVTNGTATYNEETGTVEFTPTTDFIGMAEFDVNFQGVTKHVCIDYSEGNSTPAPFFFAPKTNVAQSSVQTSNPIIVTETTMPSPISIVGGLYSINEGSWVSTAGTVNPNDSVSVRLNSASTNLTTTTTTLTIGGVSGTFSVTTANEVVSGYITATIGYVPKPVQTDRNFDYYKSKVTLSESMLDDFVFEYQILYPRLGQMMQKLITGSIPAGQTVYEAPDYDIKNADKGLEFLDIVADFILPQEGALVNNTVGATKIMKHILGEVS